MIILEIVCPIKMDCYTTRLQIFLSDCQNVSNRPESGPEYPKIKSIQCSRTLGTAMQSTTSTKDLNGSNCTLINAVIRMKQIYQVLVEWHSKGNKIEYEAKALATHYQLLILGGVRREPWS